MKNRILHILVVLLLVGFSAKGQQDPQYTNYMFSKMTFNPAYTGMSQTIYATALIRQQWMGFEDPFGNAQSPQTSYMKLDAPVRVLYGGIGVCLVNDKIGFENTTAFRLSYTFHLNAGQGKLGLGSAFRCNQ